MPLEEAAPVNSNSGLSLNEEENVTLGRMFGSTVDGEKELSAGLVELPR